MISIIICSAQKSLLESVTENIRGTIGVPFEIIAFDNSKEKRGISEVYNRNSLKARYDILCFMHEDVFFETADWGKNVVHHLSDPRVGLIGVAGGDTKSKVPSSWPSYIFENEISLIQHFKNKQRAPEKIVKTNYPGNDKMHVEVCCIDGVWLCMRRDVMEHVRFDEKACPAFHGYDIDISLQVFRTYKVNVVFDIMLHHFSDGSFDKAWLENSIRVTDKWISLLPCSVKSLTDEEWTRQHWTAMNVFIDKMQKLGYSRIFMFRQLFRYGFNGYFHFRHFLHSSKRVILNSTS